MKNKFIFSLLLFFGFLLSTNILQAHQPQAVFDETRISVSEPEISKAYYGNLDGQANFFLISNDAPFDLYVNVLVPDVLGVRKNISFEIRRNGQLIQQADGINFRWSNFYEPFAGDNYFKGPEYLMRASAGDYEIKVFSPNNVGKYTLAIGEKESFPLREVFKTLTVIPQIKRSFFGESIISAYLNQTILLTLTIIITLISIIWLFIRAYKKKK